VFALLLPALAEFVASSRGTGSSPELTVDVAPSRAVDLALERLPAAPRIRMDFDPSADRRKVDLQASVTAMPFEDGAVDLLVCSHVLEHVPDDATAMVEIARVLARGGIGLVAVPLRRGKTVEDPEASPEERIRRFGQADHVRYYGDDFDDRLHAAGLQTLSFTTEELLPDWLIELMRLMNNERFFFVATPGTTLPDVSHLADSALSLLLRTMAAQTHPQANRWHADAIRWEENYRRLRNRRPIQVLAAVDRLRRRANKALRTR
jgi:SAM-dependent methyltransferase